MATLHVIFTTKGFQSCKGITAPEDELLLIGDGVYAVLEESEARLHAIRDQNEWQRYHSPKNLAMAASVEMAELVEIFQWQTEDESRQLPSDKLAHAGQEVGDILMYLLLMCSELGIDMEQALLAKLADNERRFAR